MAIKQVELKNGGMVVLRELTREDRFPGGAGRCPANCRMVLDGSMEPTERFRELDEVLIEKCGATAIVAADGDLVAGFVSFYPTWCPHPDICSDDQIDEAISSLREMPDAPECDDPALHVRCLMVRPEYRGNGLAVHLLASVKAWARAHGWRKIVGNGCIFSGRAQYQWLVAPKPPKPIWEKAGFRAADFAPLGMPAQSDEESARGSLEWYASEQFPEHLPRDIAPDDPDWHDVFADYTMVCEL